MKHVLVVANQTATSRRLLDEVAQRSRKGECRFTLVVPAARPGGVRGWEEERTLAMARERMNRALVEFRHLGADVEGMLASSEPLDAVEKVARQQTFDEVIVSTLPKGRSRWLEMDLPARVAESLGVPVTHVAGEPEGVVGPGPRPVA